MASLNPSQNTTVTLYKNVDVDNDETLAFSSEARREAYFGQHTNVDLTHIKCSPIKKDTGRIKIKANLEDVIDCNYMSFINQDFGNKKYYCRIVVDPDFSTKKTVIVDYIIDWWITDMPDVEFDECYIERSGLSEADYNKSVQNPYNPTIQEFRTAETLPINRDVEKPYYELGTTAEKDGVFAGDAICSVFNVPNRPGMLLIFSDINLSNADGEAGAVAGSPSSFLKQYITDVVYNGTNVKDNLCWYKMSHSLYEYLSSAYTVQSQFGRGSKWGSSGLMPGGSNQINAPVSYVYIDSMGNASETDDNMTIFSNLLGWFTDNECLDNILGIYAVPTGMMYFSGNVYSQPVEVKMPTSAGQNVVNRKLDYYPYSFYKVIGPNGDEKELRIEDFKNVQDAQNPANERANIGISLDCVENPNLLVAPKNYRLNGITPHGGSNMNSLEKLLFSQFPCVPYSIDSYRMAMASQANQIIGNNTVQYQYDFAERTGGGNAMLFGGLKNQVALQLEDLAGDMHKAAGASGFLGSLVYDLAGNIFDVAGLEAQSGAAKYNKMNNEANMSNEATKVLTGSTDNAIYNNSRMTRPAYASSEYHAMSMPSTNFNNNSFMDILILRVQLNPVILAQYDKYLTMYGMSSGKCEVPLIKHFVDGLSYEGGTTGHNTVLPHWYSLNGKSVYYIKTVNCKILHKNLVASAYIKQMFDNGVRFINGDTLISNE